MTDKQQPESVEPEDKEPNESSRRRFLLGAATLAAGAIAAEKAAAGEESSLSSVGCGERRGGLIIGPDGRIQCCSKPTFEEAKRYAGAMWVAALSSSYRDRLLTFGPLSSASINWKTYTPQQRSDMLNETWEALDAAGAKPDPKVKYVVLSSEQFETQVYFMQEASEKVLRLPDTVLFPFGPLETKGDVKHLLDSEKLLTKDVIMDAAAQTLQSHICGM